MKRQAAVSPYVAGAVVAGVSAHVLDRILAQPNVAQVLRCLPSWMGPEVEATRRAIGRAAREYERLPVAVDGTAETPPVEVGPPSEREIGMFTNEAAALLALSERRVRQLAAGGMGRKAGGRWLLDRGAVAAEAARRRSA